MRDPHCAELDRRRLPLVPSGGRRGGMSAVLLVLVEILARTMFGVTIVTTVLVLAEVL